MLSCLCLLALWSPAGKGLASGLSCMWCCHCSIRCPGSCVVLDCIDSWSLPSSWLCILWSKREHVESYALNTWRFNISGLSKAVVQLLLTFCLLLLPLLESVIVLCFVVRCFVSVLVLQSSWWGNESWLLCLICLPGVSWWLSGSSSRCHRVVCGLWLWYFLIILTYYFSYMWWCHFPIRCPV